MLLDQHSFGQRNIEGGVTTVRATLVASELIRELCSHSSNCFVHLSKQFKYGLIFFYYDI